LDMDGPFACLAQPYRRDHRRKTAIAFSDSRILNRDFRWCVIVEDCPLPLSIEDGGAYRIAQRNEESLVAFVRRVAVDRNDNLMRGLIGRKSNETTGS